MKNIPRRDTEKKLVAPGVLNSSNSSKSQLGSPSFNIMRRGSEVPIERFNEDFLLPKSNHLQSHLTSTNPETPQGNFNNGNSSYRSTHLKRDHLS